ncbi:GspE/PulE family protein [Thiohalophilus sp.]|uniref:GspE/PulE family protein n=1 Tax=Thiohalophilus sp. TaxID=3028392 RepID=UPI002ACD289C|nr:ATPase, T2SS/T4P/T4SS family [Thiohalophilus sp.]MDZ7803407.1 ATPase, T2SS/T4P/T4SS family [Thiohalophilus sp.]
MATTTAPRKKIRLGDLLVENNVISEDQLMAALADQKKTGQKLGRTLIQKQLVTEQQLMELLSTQLNLPFIDLKKYNYDPDTVRLIPETLARRYRVIALKQNPDNSLLVGMADPTDIFAFDELAKVLKRDIQQAVVRESDLLAAIDSTYRRTADISNLAEELDDQLDESDIDLSQIAQNEDVVNAPVVRLLQTLFEDAVQIGASDIHIEPDESVLRIRQRVDGVLQEQVMKEKRIANALVSRLKLMAGLNISERRVPQDGRFNIRVRDKSIDVRLSTMPVQHGESVVMRLLDQSGDMLHLEQLGMTDDILQHFRNQIQRPYGMVLVTGPTGSGKTTTLYAALSELNDASKKIITVEDPVEYRLPRINQVQVNTRIDLTFGRVLRAALRQDPDIVLIGEMRDQETAQIGLRASITGHLVLSTLHTNDAISSVNRLLDMGAEGYLLAGALRAVIAQRLVRRVCDSCKTPYHPEPNELAWLYNTLGDEIDETRFVHGAGCPHCNNTGYHGRIGVFEYLEINEDLANALRRSDSVEFTRQARRSDTFRPFARHALDYAQQGVTSLEEVMRVTGTVEEVELPVPPLDEAGTDDASEASHAPV